MKPKEFEMVRYDMHGEIIGRPPKLWVRVYWGLILLLLLPVILSFLPSFVAGVQDDIKG